MKNIDLFNYSQAESLRINARTIEVGGKKFTLMALDLVPENILAVLSNINPWDYPVFKTIKIGKRSIWGGSKVVKINEISKDPIIIKPVRDLSSMNLRTLEDFESYTQSNGKTELHNELMAKSNYAATSIMQQLQIASKIYALNQKVPGILFEMPIAFWINEKGEKLGAYTPFQKGILTSNIINSLNDCFERYCNDYDGIDIGINEFQDIYQTYYENSIDICEVLNTIREQYKTNTINLALIEKLTCIYSDLFENTILPLLTENGILPNDLQVGLFFENGEIIPLVFDLEFYLLKEQVTNVNSTTEAFNPVHILPLKY